MRTIIIKQQQQMTKEIEEQLTQLLDSGLMTIGIGWIDTQRMFYGKVMKGLTCLIVFRGQQYYISQMDRKINQMKQESIQKMG